MLLINIYPLASIISMPSGLLPSVPVLRMTCPGLGWKAKFYACALNPISCHLLRNIPLTFHSFSWVINYFLLAGSSWSACKYAVIFPTIKKFFLDHTFLFSYSPLIACIPFFPHSLFLTPFYLNEIVLVNVTSNFHVVEFNGVQWLVLILPDMSAAFDIRNTPSGNTFSSILGHLTLLVSLQLHWLLLSFLWPLLIVPTLSNLTLEGPRALMSLIPSEGW